MKCLGDATRALKNYERAQKYYEDSLQLARFIGWEDLLISDVYHGLGYPSLQMGNDVAAEDYFLHAVKIDQENDDKALLALSLLNFASLATFRKEPITAARLFGAFHTNMEALQAELGLNEKIIYLIDKLETDQYLGDCRAQVNKSVFDQAWNAGCQLSLDEAIDEILQKREEIVIS
jgi:tetratricopeptide (TPR) repeat protein